MKTVVQAFAIRDELRQDFQGTIQALKAMGFDGFEMGMYFDQDHPKIKEQVKGIKEAFGGMPGCIWTEKEAKEKVAYVREQGLLVESCHLFFMNAYEHAFRDHLDRMIDFAKAVGLKQYVVSYMLDEWPVKPHILEELKAASQAFEARGIHLAYHNHNVEMKEVEGLSVLEHVMEAVPCLSLQPDLGWMEAGQGDVLKILEKYASRIYSIHYKDLYYKQGLPKDGIVCTPIGGGDVDSLVVNKVLDHLNLLEGAMIIDQDNAIGSMMEELDQGRRYILENIG